MKKLIFLLAALITLTATHICAQSYQKMWKEVSAAQARDLPQSAVATIDRIITVAKQRGDNGQLLRALLMRMHLQLDISQDSASALLPVFVKACAEQTSPADRCIYNMVLGWLQQSRDHGLHPQSRDSAYRALSLAVENPGALAQEKSNKWGTILSRGADSRIYNNDMLSVVFPFTAEQLQLLGMAKADSLAREVMHKEISYYSAHRMTAAQMMAKMDSARILGVQDSAFYATLIREFRHCDTVTQAYLQMCRLSSDSLAYALSGEALAFYPKSHNAAALKNIRNRLTQAQADINSILIADSTKLLVNHKNLSEITVGVCRLPYSATSPQILNLREKDYPTLYSKPKFQKTYTLKEAEPWRQVSDTVCFKTPDNGIYLVRVSAPGCKERYSLLRVSHLSVIQLPLPDESVRICIVDASNGKPIEGATLRIATQNGSTTSWETLTADGSGQIVLSNRRGYATLYPSTPTDNAHDGISLRRSYAYSWNRTDDYQSASLHTDRAIYRPGQKVKVGGFVYYKSGDSTRVLAGESVELTLYDANGKKIESAGTISDDFGAFGTEFTLPAQCLNGTFSVRHANGYTSFRVEEYKRPNFRISLEQPQQGYAIGDTVIIEGKAETYSGFPVKDAKVVCILRRERSWWFRTTTEERAYTRMDTVLTDAQGYFRIPVILSGSSKNDKTAWPRFYSYTLTTRITGLDGETQEAMLRLSAGSVPLSVNADAPEMLCREKPRPLTASQYNNAGQMIDGEGKYIVYRGHYSLSDLINFSSGIDNHPESRHAFSTAIAQESSGSINFNQKSALDFLYALKTGEYTIVILPTADNDLHHAYQQAFTVFSLSDTRPAGKEPLQLWQSGDFNSQDTVDVILSTAEKDTWLRYDIMAAGRLIHSQVLNLSDTVLHFRYCWEDSWGKGMHAQFAILKDNQLIIRSLTLTKPLPDKKLDLAWTSFRDKLQPSQSETWTLKVLKGGKPVPASILATMYDASLDKFARHALRFSLGFSRFVPQLRWNGAPMSFFSLNLWHDIATLKETSLRFTRLSDELFGQSPLNIFRYYGGPLLRMNKAANFAVAESKMAPLAAMPDEAMAESSDAIGSTTSTSRPSAPAPDNGGAEESPDLLSTAALRTDFSETAFFFPSLHTDDNGEARIVFTLPQSLTRWNVKALAHTRDLSYGFIDTCVVVSKPFMVQANMPRFLREGDKALLAITLRNNDSLPHQGRIQMELKDASTDKRLTIKTLPFNVQAREDTVLLFPVDAQTGHSLLICRYVAVGNRFSDGEQQYLPVLSALQKTMSTVPFTLTDGKSKEISLKDLDYRKDAIGQQLTVEFTGNPAWTALTSLPAALNYNSHCVTQIAANYCALTLMRRILTDNPAIPAALARINDSIPAALLPLENNEELKQIVLNETPWVGSADKERDNLRALKDDSLVMSMKQATMLHRLQQMQNADGGWMWFPGMESSTWLTTDIAEMLERLVNLVPGSRQDVLPMLNRAIGYLDARAAEAVADMKKTKATIIPTRWMRYLYIALNHTALTGTKTSSQAEKTRRYLIEKLDLSATGYNMYDKAMAACVLALDGREKEAALTMKSLLEHTVSAPAMGRYFDSRRAPVGWSMYRIPTQIAAIEAIERTMPEAVDTLKQMRLWLLQSKHTQSWDEPLVACRAVECLLSGGALASPTAVPADLTLTLNNGRKQDLMDAANMKDGEVVIDPFVEMGYVKAKVKADALSSAPKSLIVKPSAAVIEQQAAFGAVYLQQWTKDTDIRKSASVIDVESSLWIERNAPEEKDGAQWQPYNGRTPLHKGERIKVRFRLSTSRDLDFVSLKDGRAACMEPEDNLSGYDWRAGAYREVEDASTTFFFHHLSKGTHVVEVTYSIDRSGTYRSAPTQAQCQYAPELFGKSAIYSLTVE